MLVACVGNVLRGDDGFGLAVAGCLQGRLPAGVDLIETGTAGLGIVHQLMDGYGGLIVVDLVDRHVAPGTVLVLVPDVPDVAEPTIEDWRTQIADLHLAEPSRLLRLARASGVLPERVVVVACQPQGCEGFGEGLSPPVAAAVPVATRRVHELVDELRLEPR